jgi:hypothetical protein
MVPIGEVCEAATTASCSRVTGTAKMVVSGEELVYHLSFDIDEKVTTL